MVANFVVTFQRSSYEETSYLDGLLGVFPSTGNGAHWTKFSTAWNAYQLTLPTEERSQPWETIDVNQILNILDNSWLPRYREQYF